MPTVPAPPAAGSNDTAGLPPGRQPEPDADRRTGDELIGAAAAGKDLRGDEQADLLDYYLTNRGLPGDRKPRPVKVTLGDDGEQVTDTWRVRRITWDELRDANEHATATDQATGEQMTDRYVMSSWVVARALQFPPLGPAVKAQQDEAAAAPDKKIDGPTPGERIDPPADAAEFLRRMFATQSDVLFELSGYVLRISKLTGQGGSVKALDEEVAAGKS